MYKPVGDAITAALNNILATSKLAAVFAYETKTATVYPFAMVTPRSGSEKPLDTSTNEQEVEFVVTVADMNKNVAVMEDRMRTLHDDVMTELRRELYETL